MISCNHIGRLGRLGNQMFQYAGLKGIADFHGYTYCIPPVGHHELCNGFMMESISTYAITNYDESTGRGEGHFHFNYDLLNNCPDNVNISGYFQTEKYFAHTADNIKKDFTFKPEYLDKASSFIQKAQDKLGPELVAICVRRGDYLNYPDHHPVCSIGYYRSALDMLPNYGVVIVSDDKEWCEQNFTEDRFIVSDKDHHYFTDMCVLSLCKYHVISNSTFSWWGAWLSPKKRVIAPSRWFGSALSHDTKDVCPENWTKI